MDTQQVSMTPPSDIPMLVRPLASFDEQKPKTVSARPLLVGSIILLLLGIATLYAWGAHLATKGL